MKYYFTTHKYGLYTVYKIYQDRGKYLSPLYVYKTLSLHTAEKIVDDLSSQNS